MVVCAFNPSTWRGLCPQKQINKEKLNIMRCELRSMLGKHYHGAIPSALQYTQFTQHKQLESKKF